VTDVVLRAGTSALTVATASGGRFASLNLDGLEVLGRGGPGMYAWGSYPMAPYAGRVRHGRLTWGERRRTGGPRYQLPIQLEAHAIHGVTVDRPWTVLDATAATVSLRCDFDVRWPWPGHAIQHLTLADDQLHAVLEVHSDEEPMPAWTGYHPWFARRLARGEQVRIEVPCAGLLAKDGDGMPTDQVVPVPAGPWDDCFADISWPARLVWDGAVALEISSPCRYAVVFDERPDAVCVEPQTAPPNAAELGLATTVEPGSPLSMEMTWSWTSA